VFKLINEAYGVLSDSSSRREYDNERRLQRPGQGNLKVRNEGIYGGTGPVERPTSIYEAPADWQGSRSGSAGGVTYVNESGERVFDEEGAFRASMARASERQKDGARLRAAMQRMNRPRVDVPDQTASIMKMALPVLVVGVWGFNYWFFMR
jgi:curved DNA-binding protein CbpA